MQVQRGRRHRDRTATNHNYWWVKVGVPRALMQYPHWLGGSQPSHKKGGVNPLEKCCRGCRVCWPCNPSDPAAKAAGWKQPPLWGLETL